MREDTDSLMLAMQKLQCVDLIETDTFPQSGLTERMAEENAEIARCRQAMDFLSSYRRKNRALFPKIREMPLNREYDASDTVSHVCALADELQHATNRLTAVKNEYAALEVWQHCTLPLPASETVSVKTICGFLPGNVHTDTVEGELAGLACVFIVECAEKARNAVSLIVHRTEFDNALGILTGYGFTPVTLNADGSEGYAAGKRTALSAEQHCLEETCTRLRKDAAVLSEKLEEVEVYYDYLTTAQARTAASACLSFTNQTAVLTGWVPEKMTDAVAALLDKRKDAFTFADPVPEDDVPVLLINNPFATAFEPVVGLYALPAYGTFDPTFIMSFFYIILFGLMFADAGYGLLLIIACIAALRFMKPVGNLKKFITMFALCGMSMTVMGVVFSGYFGDLPAQIHTNFLDGDGSFTIPALLNPLSDPMTFLAISLVMGAVHLFTALGVKFYVLWKTVDPLSAVFDAGSWMLVFLGAGSAGIGLFTLPVLFSIGIGILFIGLFMLILTQGRHEKNPFMKVLKGIMSLYDIVGYISDLLSYSRILSLGLASAVIASVFNIIGTMAGPSVIGILLLLIVGTIGHVMNLAINLLGTFVHTSRLQYIEFFGKFYEDGGRPFSPLAPQSRYIRFR